MDGGTLLVNGSIASATTVGSGGTLGGTGTVGAVVVNSGGTLAPGKNAPGQFTIGSTYTQVNNAMLAIELGGYTQGVGYDHLVVSGHAALSGVLRVALTDGFRPNVGDTFTILTSGSLGGNFSSVVGVGLTAQANVVGASIVVTITAIAPLPLVENTNDSGPGSLRFVIANAPAGSTIVFAPQVRGAIELTSGELLIGKNLTLDGPGANLLTVRRSATAPNARIFNVAPASVTARIVGLTIANGNAVGASGGGIHTAGTLTLSGVTISGNVASNGGGIWNQSGALTILGSTISGNSVSHSFLSGSGGGIYNSGGALVLKSSTLSGNTAHGPGGNSDSGGGLITNVGTVTLNHCTIAGNSGDLGGGIRNVNGGTVTARNTLIASNLSPSGPDVNGPLHSQGFILIGNTSGATLTGWLDLRDIDPLLGPLQDNGGPTRTRALLPGSPALDQGSGDGIATDQRGFTRVVDFPETPNAKFGDGTDIGALESGALPLRVTSIVRSGTATIITFADAAYGATYRLERKLLLTDPDWHRISGVDDVTAFTTGPNGPVQITDPDTGTLGAAFYRVRLIP